MKISDFIVYLESIKEANGDIDVICVTPGCSQSWQSSEPNEDSCVVFKTDDFDRSHNSIRSDKYLFVGIY